MAACRRCRRSGAVAPSIAERTRSCRNRTTPASRARKPDHIGSSSAHRGVPARASSRRRRVSGVRLPATAAASSALRASADSRDARAMTASRTVAGTSVPPLAITSRMKNGLPPVRRCSSSASPPASRRVAARLSGPTSMRWTPGAVARSPSSTLSGQPGGASSSRNVARRRIGRRVTRRPRYRRTSSVAWSAQCTSSSVTSRGDAASASSSGGPGATAARSRGGRSGSSWPASSRNGASACGVPSGSHTPSRARPAGRARARWATSEDLPMPASPPISTRLPSPASAAAMASASSPSCRSRSRREGRVIRVSGAMMPWAPAARVAERGSLESFGTSLVRHTSSRGGELTRTLPRCTVPVGPRLPEHFR